jgi:Ring hydroxylating alpha subunit (catalytic domain)
MAEQDNQMVRRNQAGIESLAYEPGRSSKTEDFADNFVSWYINKMLV